MARQGWKKSDLGRVIVKALCDSSNGKDFGYKLKLEPPAFTDGLDMGYEQEREGQR